MNQTQNHQSLSSQADLWLWFPTLARTVALMIQVQTVTMLCWPLPSMINVCTKLIKNKIYIFVDKYVFYSKILLSLHSTWHKTWWSKVKNNSVFSWTVKGSQSLKTKHIKIQSSNCLQSTLFSLIGVGSMTSFFLAVFTSTSDLCGGGERGGVEDTWSLSSAVSTHTQPS